MYYHTLNEELRRRFGCKVYKLALDGGFTCPNRDGTIGARGCIFCAGDGSGAFAADRALDIPQQIEAAKVRVAGKNGGGKYIAYFQNFLPVFDGAVRRLRAAGLEVIVHQILGLPGETDAQMVQTARYIGQSGAQGIKLHLLHVLRGTDLAADYAAGKFEVLTPEHYIDLLEQCLCVLPPEVVIHRLTGDGAKRDLIAPLWSADKKRVLNAIHAAFARDDLVQGSEL